MRKKISTTIYVTLEQADKLKLLHERTKVPVAVYIREGIDLVLRHYAHLLPGQLALVDEFGSGSQPPPPMSGAPTIAPMPPLGALGSAGQSPGVSDRDGDDELRRFASSPPLRSSVASEAPPAASASKK